MALIDPKTLLPVTSQSKAQPPSAALLDLLAHLPPIPRDMLEQMAGQLIDAYHKTRMNIELQQGFQEGQQQPAAILALSAPVTVELGVFMSILGRTLATTPPGKPEPEPHIEG